MFLFYGINTKSMEGITNFERWFFWVRLGELCKAEVFLVGCVRECVTNLNMSNRTTAYVLFLVFVFLLLNVRQEHMNQDKIKEEITHLEAERAILANMTYGEDRANKVTIAYMTNSNP